MAKRNTTILVQEITVKVTTKGTEDYLCLTDMAKQSNERTDVVIQTWLRNRNTIEFIRLWEELYNPNFNHSSFAGISEKVGLNNFYLSPKKWVEETNAIGIEAKAGRYGGTYAHRDIAFEFATWLSPAFKLYLIKEFQRLKEEEVKAREGALEWNLRRTLSKINYTVHADAVKENLIPLRLIQDKRAGFVYASEADLLNVALFGMTARDWKAQNPEAKGNMREHATMEQLLVLANLEAINAELIRQRLSQDERLVRMNEAAITQMRSILTSPSLSKLPSADK